MKSLVLAAALLGAVGLVTSSPAGAASSTAIVEGSASKSMNMQLAQAQRPYDPSAGSVGFKKKKKAKKKMKK
jgi:hypothetical protein